MKYFRPDLLIRCRSLDDGVAEAAAEELDRASDAYRARLRILRAVLPRGVRRLVSTVSLHDAKVLNLSFGKKKPRFVLRVRLEGSQGHPGEILELNYHAVVGVREEPAGPRWTLNNEFDVDQERGFFTHCLLLTSGLEIEVRFHSLSLQYLEEIDSQLQLDAEERTWPLVEA